MAGVPTSTLYVVRGGVLWKLHGAGRCVVAGTLPSEVRLHERNKHFAYDKLKKGTFIIRLLVASGCGSGNDHSMIGSLLWAHVIPLVVGVTRYNML